MFYWIFQWGTVEKWFETKPFGTRCPHSVELYIWHAPVHFCEQKGHCFNTSVLKTCWSSSNYSGMDHNWVTNHLSVSLQGRYKFFPNRTTGFNISNLSISSAPEEQPHNWAGFRSSYCLTNEEKYGSDITANN